MARNPGSPHSGVITVDMMKGREPPQPAKRKAGARKAERAFDEWLNRGLHDLFDQVVREPVPDDLMKLIEEDRKK